MLPTLKHSQRKDIEDDLSHINDSLTNPNMAPYIQNKSAMQRQAQQLKQQLEQSAPKPFTSPEEKDGAMRRERELREKFLADIPSKEEMRKNRDGSVDSHMKWEKTFKPDILEWREIRKRLNPDDPQAGSYEQYRPSRPFGLDTSSQIQSPHIMSEQAKENYPEEMAQPKATTAISHMKEVFSNIFPAKPEAEETPPTKAED